jgi:hypothetical protein
VTTALIIVCIVFCIAVVLGITGHLGYAIVHDKHWRMRIQRHHQAHGRRSN